MIVPSKAELEQALSAPAYINEAEIEPFCRYASLPHNRVLVEIGAGYGASAVLMLLSAPRLAFVYSIDSFTGDSMRNWRAAYKECVANVQDAADNLGYDSMVFLMRWQPCVSDSHSASIRAHDLFRDLIDFLYIDGDHHYDAVRQDFDDWLPLVNKGGVILLHDSRRLPDAPEGHFARGWPGPTRLAEELHGEPTVELIEEAFSLTIWRKR